ncbi:MAG TPA: outer membrane protein assembly factor BamE [Burkholderiales bacterium]|nr:outer membrane protein assembly factor BamE [Burkholderiales bacterium]
MMQLRGIALIVLFLVGCRELPVLPTLTPYKIDIQQGNVVTQDMVEKLKPGMTPSQVRFILGTPLVVDTFHKDRWDYVYRYERAGRLQEHRRIVVVFQDEKLARIEGDVIPAKSGGATEGGVRIDQPAPDGAKPAPATKPEITGPQPEGARIVTGTREPTTAGEKDAAPGDAAKVEEGKPGGDKPKEERGFFGRMLEKLGF